QLLTRLGSTTQNYGKTVTRASAITVFARQAMSRAAPPQKSCTLCRGRGGNQKKIARMTRAIRIQAATLARMIQFLNRRPELDRGRGPFATSPPTPAPASLGAGGLSILEALKVTGPTFTS